nr:ORF1 [Torque teno virus 11]
MAWRWWKRRRRGWLRSLWRRRRFARRRLGRPARRYRRRRVRRKRRWRRGRPRRRLYRRRRRFKRRRRRRPKIKITQWQPSAVKRAFIIGYFPAVICGPGRWSENFTSHIEDKVAIGSYGGGHSTSRWSLKVLYEEFQKHHNFWTRSNKELDLVRFFGSTWTFYRHEDTDYIVTYNRKAPMGGNVLTAPSLHPGAAMLTKHKIVVPSFKTRPGGKPTVKFRIKPPTTFTDKWYFQKDMCDVTLLNLNVVLCNLRFPFCSPQTANVNVTFQILHDEIYHNFLSITAQQLIQNQGANWKGYYKQFLQKALPNDRAANRLNTFITEGAFHAPQVIKYQKPANNTTEYFRTKDAQWGDAIHIVNNAETVTGQKTQTLSDLITKITDNAENYLKKVQQEFSTTTVGSTMHGMFTHWTGMFSPAFLNFNRISPEIPGFYKDIIYNPLVDKGIGNGVWIDYLSKNDTKYSPTQSKCGIFDLPLWMACYGLVDWCKKETGNWGIPDWARVIIKCPYTFPKLINSTDETEGFVPIGYNFAQGYMPDGSKYIPILRRHRWYPNLLNQQAVLEDISRSGPFAYTEKTNSANITAKYKFRFHLGGNPVSEQVVADPCNQPTYQMPGTGDLPRRIQVTDPKHIGPHYTFHSWDKRRDYFSRQTIKRMSEQQETSEFLFSGPKKPRVDLDAVQIVEKDYFQEQREQRPWETSQSEEESEAPSEEEETQTVQQQLKQQLRQQKQLRRGINCLFEQLIKTQQGVHLDPSLV